MASRPSFLFQLVVLAGAVGLVACGRGSQHAPQFVPQPAVDASLSTLPPDWGIVQAEQVQAEQPFLVDVREPNEYATGFIEGAVNIPLRTLAQHLEALPGLDEEIVVTCCSGPRSAIALTALRALGYQEVRLLAGGVNGWRAASLPLVGGPGPELVPGPSPEIDPDLRAAVVEYLSARAPDDWGQVELADFEALLESGPPFLLDVRQPDEVEGDEIDGAVNIPLRDVPAHLDQVPKDEPVIVMDASGHRSTITMAALQMLGYDQVGSLHGGIMGWRAAGGSEGEYREMTEALNAFLAAPPPEWGLVDPEAAQAAEPFWLDVRPPEAYDTGSIAGARNIPLRQLTEHLDLLPGAERTIIVVSDSGAEAAIGMLALQSLGYREARTLAGGVAGWEAAGFPLTAEPAPEMAAGDLPAVNPKVLESLAFYLGSALPPDFGQLDVPGFLQATDKTLPGVPVTVIDVRDPEAFAASAIDGAVNLALANLLEGVGDIPAEPLRTS
jgi:rhodanese-related sulfurtransferase